MKLNAPTQIVFIISAVLFILALAVTLGVSIPFISGNVLWVALASYAILAAGNLFKGL